NFLVYSENLTSVVYNAYSSPYGEYSFPTRRSSDLGLIHANAELGLLEVGSVRETNERTSSGEITASFDVAEGLDPSSVRIPVARDRESTRLNSSHVKRSYAVFCLKKKK